VKACCSGPRRAARRVSELTGRSCCLPSRTARSGDRAAIDEGQHIVRWCLVHNQPGPYQLQAAIGAVHVHAASAEETDWSQVLALYDQLLEMAPTPVVALNRAVAIGEVHGPAAAPALIDRLDLDHYYLLHATRADLLWRLGRQSEAEIAYTRAAALAPTDAERQFLSRGGRRSRH
jgi:RNA polymerase sigma-70 factor, ECF subfamily